ncbi:hypothetical protein SOVF_155470 [Spinacia oleracea]|uniref:Uncharacterized protein n=1 Tax=Spinacia oleracea TaxID=3562 RepID=A0A9R0JQD5_SPIOL|nr:uncharacterized protein LOC110783251 [Spinacia oleracea]KNA09235.1 hypothetical protein SOVF_155470 [Spinacia oleracea]
MASVQQFSDKEKAAIGEAMKEAESLMLAKNKKAAAAAAASSQDHGFLVIGVMKNLYSTAIERLGEEWNWMGSFEDSPPQKIEKNGIGSFAHNSKPEEEECSGAFKYCSDSSSKLKRGWILAWMKYKGNNRVYVEAGTQHRINQLKESDIKYKLKVSGPTSRYWDSDTGASAIAEIKDWEVDGALIAVSFDQF